MLLRPSGLIGHSLRSGKSPNLCFRSINEFALCAMASKELFPQITLWIPLVFFTVRPWKSPKFFVSQKSSNPEWQGRTVNLLWLVVSKMFFFFFSKMVIAPPTSHENWSVPEGIPSRPTLPRPMIPVKIPMSCRRRPWPTWSGNSLVWRSPETVTLCELENGPFIDDFFHGFT